MSDQIPDVAGFRCEFCEKIFTDKSAHWRHKNKKKTPCVSMEKFNTIIQESEMKDTKLQKYEIVTKQLENECKQLRQLVDNISQKDNIIFNKIDEVANRLDLIDEQIIINPNVNTKINNCLISNSNSNNLNFSVRMSEPSKEILSHIKPEELLCILNHNQFTDSLAHLIVAVFFHPKCPENWRWCVNDKKAKYGGLEYDHKTNTLITRSTEELITENVQNVVFQVGDILEKAKLETEFNINQVSNYHRIYGLVGSTDIGKENLKRVRDVAHENRNFPKVLWNQLNIGMSTTDYNHQIKLKTK